MTLKARPYLVDSQATAPFLRFHFYLGYEVLEFLFLSCLWCLERLDWI